MDIRRVFAVYFSPTGGSRRYVQEIARRLDPRVTDPQACIVCLACMKNCPAHARTVPGPGLEAVCQQLEGLLLARRQEPQWYF